MSSIVSSAASKLYTNRILSRKVAGEHSLNIGEIIALVVAAVLWVKKEKIPVVGKYWVYLFWLVLLAAFFIW